MNYIIFKIPVKVKQEGESIVYYNSRYNISGYGKTPRQARKMFKDCVDDILTFKKK